MIVAKDIYKNFGDIKAIDGVSFSVDKGVLALLGVNGAGKTTLIRTLTGYIIPQFGEVKIYESDILEDRLKALSYIGYVPENNPIYSDLTSYDFIRLAADLWQVSDEKFEERLRVLVKELDIKSVINQKIETLSKGYKRRVGIAASLIHNPKVLILDEPTDGLDPNQKIIVRKFIKDYAKDNIVIISTHIMEDVEAVADRILIMDKGKIILDTTPAKLKSESAYDSMADAFYKVTKNNKE